MHYCILFVLFIGGSAELRVESVGSEQLLTHVQALFVAVERSIDRTVLELSPLTTVGDLGLKQRVNLAASDRYLNCSRH